MFNQRHFRSNGIDGVNHKIIVRAVEQRSGIVVFVGEREGMGEA